MTMDSDAAAALRNERANNAMRFYLVFMKPADGAGDRSAIRPQHFAFLQDLEDSGALIAGGPFVDGETDATTGSGMFIMRGNSADEIQTIMEEEPFYRAGLRTFTVQPWRLAEGEVLTYLKSQSSSV